MITTAIGTQDTRVEYRPTVDLIDQEIVGVSTSLVPVGPYRSGETLSEESLVELAEAIPNRLSRLLDEGLSTLSGWLDRDLRIEIAFPLSRRDLADPGLADLIDGAVAAYRIDPTLLTFEIPEGVVTANPDDVATVAEDLVTRQMRVSIDSCGPGVSRSARHLPIAELKMKPAFVRYLADEPADVVIVRDLIEVAHSLSAVVVATGVETESARDALRSMGCDRLQGHLISRPLPLDKLERWFSSRSARRNLGAGWP